MARQVDLSRLDDFLRPDRAPENGMGLSDLDGFLTGIAIGPELILPSEWLPHVCGGEAPVFESTAEAQAILSAIMARYNEILAAVQHGPGHPAPVFWVGPDGETVIAADWAEGFVDAMELRAEAWLPLIQDRAHGRAVHRRGRRTAAGPRPRGDHGGAAGRSTGHDPAVRGHHPRLLA